MFVAKSRMSTAVTSEIMPRPYCAAAPDSCRSWATPTLVPRPAWVSVAVMTMLACPRAGCRLGDVVEEVPSLVDRLGDLELVPDQHGVSLFGWAAGSFSNARRQ